MSDSQPTRTKNQEPRTAIGWRFAILVLLVLTLLLPSASAHAQQAPITITNLSVGFEGTYRADEWFAVRATISNRGPAVQGRAEWRFAANQVTTFAQEFDLPSGAQKPVTLFVTTNDFSRNGELVVTVAGSEQAKQSVRLESLDSDQLLIAIVSSDPALLNSLNGMSPTNFNAVNVRHIDLAALPEQAQALNSVNMLFIHDSDTATLSDRQRGAIAAWVAQGGHLIVGGGSNGVQTAAGLADLLPVEVGGVQQASLAPLAQGSQDASGLPTSATVNSVTPRPGAVNALGTQSPPLIYRQQHGSGTVLFAAFDLAVLRAWRGEPQLWQQVTEPVAIASLGGIARQQRLNLLGEVLRLNSLTLIPVSVLLGLLTLYVLAVGPINYLLLRRFKRLEWAWLSIPLIVFGFVGGIYLTGRLIRGTDSRLAQVAVVQAAEGSTSSTITAYNGLFSPNRGRYTFGFAPDTLIEELRTYDDSGGGGGQIVATTSASEVRDSLVDIGGIRTILSESSGATDITVQSSLNESGTTIRGDLRYNGNTQLDNAVIVRGSAFQNLGNLEPGAAATIDLKTDGTDFPWALALDEQNAVDRNQMLSRLTSMGTSSHAFIDETSVYLLGWRGTPAVAVQVNGQSATPQGVTLYVVRLKG